MRNTRYWIPALGLVTTLTMTGCGSSSDPSGPAPDPTPTLVTAPLSARVDLGEPTFSDPTSITNPLFPISELTQVVQVGSEGDVALRHEITLLPETKTIEWNGGQVETVASQFVAYGDGRLLEVATDFFAQADDGAVWYFGEDVANYVDGVLDNDEGTWLAGKDGPPGMIMPADPQVGDVYRPENIPGFVFEEVTVKSATETVDGPQGPIEGALLVEELLMDGVLEDKVFAPGYGEFLAQVVSEDELVTVSVGVPRDHLAGGVPAPLDALSAAAADLLEANADGQAAAAAIDSAWAAYRSGALSPLTVAQVDDAVARLQAAIDASDETARLQAAFDLAYAATDLRLRYDDPAAVDLGRLDLVAVRLLADAAAADDGSVGGDIAALRCTWDRVEHTIADPSQVHDALVALEAVAPTDLESAATAAADLRGALAAL